MERSPEQAKKSSWSSPYTILAIIACVGVWVMVMPSLLKRPDLAFLKPLGWMLVFGMAPAVSALRRLEDGTMTRGQLLLLFGFYALLGGATAVQLYEVLAR